MDSVGGGVVAESFPLTTVTDPKFVLFKHVLCFARNNVDSLPECVDKLPELGGGGSCPPPPSHMPMLTGGHI